MIDSKEALERLFGSYVSSKCYGIDYKKDDEDYNIIKQDLDKLEKLKKVIKLLEDNLQLVLKQDIDPLLNRKVYAVGISKNYKIYSGFEVTQEQYELIKEVLK